MKCMNAFGVVALFIPMMAYGSGCSSGSTGSGTGTVHGGGDGSAPVMGGEGDAGQNGPTDMTCAGQSTNTSCQQCCAQVHSSGYQTFASALLACACGNTGGCGSACATSACAQSPSAPASGDACETCLNTDVLTPADGGAAPCDRPIVNACGADPNCAAFAACVRPCVQKQ